MLENLEVLVFDIQDVGSRCYTYLYTLAYSMGVCLGQGKSFIVLDRPNPIDGVGVEGGHIPEESSSFVGGFGLPHRYGLTIGEYAAYLKGEYFTDIEFEIVRMKGYTREMLFPETGLPWVDGEQLRERLAALNLPGVTFTSTFFRPEFSKHKGKSCQEVIIHVTDKDIFQPLYTALSMLWLLKRDYPEHLNWREDWEGDYSFLDRLAGGSYLREMVDAGKDVPEIYERAIRGCDDFMEIRKNYLYVPLNPAQRPCGSCPSIKELYPLKGHTWILRVPDRGTFPGRLSQKRFAQRKSSAAQSRAGRAVKVPYPVPCRPCPGTVG